MILNKHIFFTLAIFVTGAVLYGIATSPRDIRKLEHDVKAREIVCQPLETIDERMAYFFKQQDMQSLADQLQGELKKAQLDLMNQKRISHEEQLYEREKNRNCK